MANYVLVVDLGDGAEANRYRALADLMYEVGFTLHGPEALRPVQFSVTSGLPLSRIKRMAEDRIRAELQRDFVVDAYEIKQLLHFRIATLTHRRRFH